MLETLAKVVSEFGKVTFFWRKFRESWISWLPNIGSAKDKHGVRESFAKVTILFAKNGRSRIKEFWSTTIYIYTRYIVLRPISCLKAQHPFYASFRLKEWRPWQCKGRRKPRWTISRSDGPSLVSDLVKMVSFVVMEKKGSPFKWKISGSFRSILKNDVESGST